MESFEPFRVVGSICSDVPISATTLYGTPLLMVATGRTYQLYKGKELAMLRGGPTFEETISSVAQSGKYRFASEGPRIHATVHHKPLWTDYHQSITKPLIVRLLAQDDLLFVLGEDKRIAVREVRTGKVLGEILVHKSETVTCMALLTGYGNKLIAATEEGALHLYNYKTGECLWYRAANGEGSDDLREGGKSGKKGGQAARGSALSTSAGAATAGAPILSLCCSRYKDIVAFGDSAGRITVLNVGSNEVITSFEHHHGAVTALCFRTDKDGMLVAGTSQGEVAVWDLENRCMDGVLTRGKQVRSEREALENAHVDAVHSLIAFAPVAPELGGGTSGNDLSALLVTGGADNALMQFRFDTVDGLGLLVRERRGHMGSCTTAAFYNNDLVVTAGADRALRVTHVFSDRASWELSQGKLGKKGRAQQKGREELKMPPAVALASSTTRNYQWASLASIHQASAQLCGWRMDTRAQEFKLSGIHTAAHTARSVAMSDCGNFAVVGYSSGNVAVLNVQNRRIWQLFDHRNGNALGDRAHEGSVECVQVACGNTTVVSAGLDGCIKMWALYESIGAAAATPKYSGGRKRDGQQQQLKEVIPTGKPINCSCVHQDSSLLLVAQHFTIRAYHCNPDLGLSRQELRQPVRELSGHTAPITAMAIAPDTARHVVSTSGDGALLLWDLAAAACVGQYRFASPATSLNFHPDSLFLVTTHAGEKGAFLWVNNLRYGFVPEVVLQPEQRATVDIPFLHFPTAHGAVEGDETAAAAAEDDAGTAASLAARRRLKTTGAAVALTEEERAEQAAHQEEMKAEAELFDATNDIALMQQKKQREQWAALDEIAMNGLRLSGVPRSTWFNLTVLDQIKEKNQPLLPPKKKDVPFFLPTTQELRPTFLLVASDTGKEPAGAAAAGEQSRDHLARADLAALTPVQEMLLNEKHDELMQYFLAAKGTTEGKHDSGANKAGAAVAASSSATSLVSAQTIDLEVKRLVDYAEGVRYTTTELDRMCAVLKGLLHFLTEWLRRGENVDLVQGILADVVRTHGQLLTRFGEVLVPDLQQLAEQQNRVRYSVDHLVSYPSTLAGTFSGSLL